MTKEELVIQHMQLLWCDMSKHGEMAMKHIDLSKMATMHGISDIAMENKNIATKMYQELCLYKDKFEKLCTEECTEEIKKSVLYPLVKSHLSWYDKIREEIQML